MPFREGFKPIFTEEQISEVEYIHILPNENNNTTTTEMMVETTETISANPNTNPEESDEKTSTNLEIQTTEDIPETITTSVITIKDVVDDTTIATTTTDSLAEEELEGISIAPPTTIDFMEIMEY